MKIMKKKTLTTITTALIIAFSATTAHADFLLARKLPTGKQLLVTARADHDEQKDTTTLSETTILKYFNDCGAGIIVGIPYVRKQKAELHTEGMGDASITAAHIITLAPYFSALPYTSLSIPTGEFDKTSKLNTGSGRFMNTWGCAVTLDWEMLEIDSRIEHALTLTNPKTGTDAGDTTRFTLSTAYHKPGLWAGIEATTQYTSSDQKNGKSVNQPYRVHSIGPEIRLKITQSTLLHLGARTDTDNNRSAELRIFYNF